MNLSQTVRLLGNILGQVLIEQESKEIFEIEEEIRDLSKRRRMGNPRATEQLSKHVKALTAEQARAVASAFALYFDLVNLAEENDRVVNFNAKRREREPSSDSIVAVVEGAMDVTAIRRALAATVETYALPRRIVAVDKIPMSAAGKYDRETADQLFATENPSSPE